MYEKLMTCLESVRKKIDFKPEVALILGSGLGLILQFKRTYTTFLCIGSFNISTKKELSQS